MTIDLVARRLERGVRVLRIGRDDIRGTDHPDAHALLPPRVEIARVLDGHARIRRMQAADMFVVEPPAGPDEYFVQRPFTAHGFGGGAHAAQLSARRRCFSAWARAASRTHAPCNHARRRAASRSALQGPLPFNTRSNS